MNLPYSHTVTRSICPPMMVYSAQNFLHPSLFEHAKFVNISPNLNNVHSQHLNFDGCMYTFSILSNILGDN